MATITTYEKGSLSAMTSQRRVGLMTNTLDCAVNNVANAAVLELLTMPAGSLVVAVVLKVETKEGGTLTVDVGDSDSANRYFSGANLNSGTVPVYLIGDAADGDDPTAIVTYFYAAANDIRVTFNNAADAAKFTLEVMYVDCS